MKSPFRTDLLAGRVALITGGGSGICRGIAAELGRHGAKLLLMGRRADVLQQTAEELAQEGLTCAVFAGDVRDQAACDAAIQEALKKFGRLDILVNGAAGNFLCPPEELSANGFRSVVEIDLIGTFQMCRAGFEALKAQHGVILNISATLHYVGTPFQSHVSAAKAGIDALTLNLGCEWGPFGIRVVGIAPGPIGDTEGMRRLAPGQVGEKLAAMIPLQRLGKIQDIALASVFLVSEAASYITGETLVVDGGHWAAKPPFIPRDKIPKQRS